MIGLNFSSTPTAAQQVQIPPGLIQLTPEDLRESLIAFVNLSTAPGLAGATFSVDEPGRKSELIRGSLGYTADLTLKDYVLDAYWGAALAFGSLEDQLDMLDADGRPTRLNVDRQQLPGHRMRPDGDFWR